MFSCLPQRVLPFLFPSIFSLLSSVCLPKLSANNLSPSLFLSVVVTNKQRIYPSTVGLRPLHGQCQSQSSICTTTSFQTAQYSSSPIRSNFRTPQHGTFNTQYLPGHLSVPSSSIQTATITSANHCLQRSDSKHPVLLIHIVICTYRRVLSVSSQAYTPPTVITTIPFLGSTQAGSS